MKKNKNKKIVKKVRAEKCLKDLLFIVLSIFFFNNVHLSVHAQTIAPYLFGQNAWMPGTIGGTPYTAHNYGGSLSSHWQDVQDSHCTSVRIGGIAYDCNAPLFTYVTGPATTAQLLTLINDVQTHGGEPIVQIAYGDAVTANGALSSADAGNLVTAINVTNIGSIQRKVKYWIIGNEPDRYTNNKTAPLIASYIKTYSAAMKSADPDIKIIAPELSYYEAMGGSAYKILTDPTDGLLKYGGANDITGSSAYGYYVDYISFHYYPFDGTQTLSNVVNTITDNTNHGFDWQLSNLNSLLTTPNSYRSSNPLQIAVTEGNINYVNPGTNNLAGLGTDGFIAGQFWAEMLSKCMKNNVQFMNFWSVREGDDLGYLRNSDGSKRSTWYHFELLANNFKGTYVDASFTNGYSDLKAFGSYSSTRSAVMVMNQSSGSYNYSINVGSGTSGSYSTKINFSSGINTSAYYNRTIAANSSTLFVFDNNGNISQETNYGLSDGTSAPANTCSTPFSCVNQTQFNAYTPGVHSSVTIGGTSGTPTAISLDATHNTVFKSVGTITITGAGGAFSSNNQALELIVTGCE
ncbi:MAG: hypothetical protein WAQ28_16300 [Bacteroidia bacterium]